MPVGKRHECPACRRPIIQRLTEGVDFVCDHCKRRYHVVADEQADRIVLVQTDAQVVSPLGLPRGSIRALVALLLSAAAW